MEQLIIGFLVISPIIGILEFMFGENWWIGFLIAIIFIFMVFS